MNILAIDVGTSSVKAGILDQASGSPISQPLAKTEYRLHHPSNDAAEIVPGELWQAVTSAARKAVDHAPPGTPIDGIGLTCLMPALVLLDAQDQPLVPIWIHLDRRSRTVARRVLNDVGDEFLASVGNRPLPGGISVLCYARQLELDPSLRGRVRRFLHMHGWLAFCLTGVAAFDPANASFTGVWNTITDQQWSSRWCDYFQLDPACLPPVVCGTTTLGGLRQDIARDWNVPAGIPVKLGTADTSSAMLAAKMDDHSLLHSVGTTQVLARLVKKPRPDPRRLTRHLGVGDHFIYVAHNPVGGVALDFLHQLCFREQSAQEFFEQSIPQAQSRTTEVRLNPPFLGGDRLEIEPRLASFTHLTLSTDRLDLLAAVLQALQIGHRQAFAALDCPWEEVRTVYLTGGGAEVVRHLIHEYDSMNLRPINHGAITGVTQLFADRRESPA